MAIAPEAVKSGRLTKMLNHRETQRTERFRTKRFLSCHRVGDLRAPDAPARMAASSFEVNLALGRHAQASFTSSVFSVPSVVKKSQVPPCSPPGPAYVRDSASCSRILRRLRRNCASSRVSREPGRENSICRQIGESFAETLTKRCGKFFIMRLTLAGWMGHLMSYAMSRPKKFAGGFTISPDHESHGLPSSGCCGSMSFFPQIGLRTVRSWRGNLRCR